MPAAMQHSNVDLDLLTETKLMNGIYTQFSLDYHIVAMEAWSHSQGGVALFFWDSPYWQVESI